MREQPELVLVPATENGEPFVLHLTEGDLWADTNHSRSTVQMPSFPMRSNFAVVPPAKLAPDLALTLAARTRTRSRESKPQGRRTRSAATSRGDPSEPDLERAPAEAV